MIDVILHLGAHRTGSTSFQSYLRAHREVLLARQIGFWGPWRTRSGLLSGVSDAPQSPVQARHADHRLRLALEAAHRHGARQLLVSDENMMGTPRRCLRSGRLYPDAGERLARLGRAFGGPRRIVLSLRALDLWWSSIISFLIPRGEDLPTRAQLDAIVDSPRSWRALIEDLARACPQSEIAVVHFDQSADNPAHLLRCATGVDGVPAAPPGAFWKNRHRALPDLRADLASRGADPGQLPAGEGRYIPFTDAQRARLREACADDLFWLRAGAGGLATFHDDTDPARTGADRPGDLTERGHLHDRQPHTAVQTPARRLAHNR